jgi:hypothetical protein
MNGIGLGVRKHLVLVTRAYLVAPGLDAFVIRKRAPRGGTREPGGPPPADVPAPGDRRQVVEAIEQAAAVERLQHAEVEGGAADTSPRERETLQVARRGRGRAGRGIHGQAALLDRLPLGLVDIEGIAQVVPKGHRTSLSRPEMAEWRIILGASAAAYMARKKSVQRE